MVIMSKFKHKNVCPDLHILCELSKVDQYLSGEWNRTPLGTLRNDIASLAMATDLNEFNAIISRLGEVRTNDQYKGMSDEQILARIAPRLSQDPTELARFAEYIGYLDKGAESIEVDKSEYESSESDKSDIGNNVNE